MTEPTITDISDLRLPVHAWAEGDSAAESGQPHDTPNVLIEMADLSRTHPGLNASAAETAAWYRRKAIMLVHAGCVDLDAAASAHADRLDHNGGQVAA